MSRWGILRSLSSRAYDLEQRSKCLGCAKCERLVRFRRGFGAYRGHVPEALIGETYMVGPRFSYRKFDRLIPFAQDLFFQSLFGGSHFSESTGDITGGGSQFTFALGGSDIGLGSTQKFALRPQLEYV